MTFKEKLVLENVKEVAKTVFLNLQKIQPFVLALCVVIISLLY